MLVGTRVRLRPIEYSDTRLIVAWRNSRHVRENLFSRSELTEDMHREWMRSNVEKGICKQFIIEIKSTSVPIGTVFIKDIDHENSKGQYGIFIGDSEYIGKGFGTEAAALILRFAFETLQLNRIYLMVLSSNVQGIRSYEKAGFKTEGVLRQGYRSGVGFCDVIVMAILDSDWRKKHQNDMIEEGNGTSASLAAT